MRQGALDGVEAFLGVAEHRNFRRAAADLGVTPSAISQEVRAFEARVGTALLVRTTAASACGVLRRPVVPRAGSSLKVLCYCARPRALPDAMDQDT